jgi:hypothetical protein
MSSFYGDHGPGVFSTPKREWHTLSVPNLMKVMIYTIMLKSSKLTSEQRAGKELQDRHDELPESPEKRTFFWDMSLVDLQYYTAYMKLTHELMDKVDSVVLGLYDQEGEYLPFICKICELLGVPPEVLAIHSKTTTVSKVAELLQYLRHLSQTFDEWATPLQPEQTLQKLKQYRRLLEFLYRIVTDKTYVLGDNGYEELESRISSLEIDLSTFFSTLEGPNTDRYIFRWIESVMLSREMGDALWLEVWHTRPNNLDEVSDKLQKKLVKLWTIVFTRISDEKVSFEDSLVFLANVLPHLIRTKHFLEDRELNENLVKALLIHTIPTVESPQDVYAEVLAKHPETFKIFPRTFTKFRSILTMTIYLWKDLKDVKALQEDPTATFETLYHDLLQ